MDERTEYLHSREYYIDEINKLFPKEEHATNFLCAFHLFSANFDTKFPEALDELIIESWKKKISENPEYVICDEDTKSRNCKCGDCDYCVYRDC